MLSLTILPTEAQLTRFKKQFPDLDVDALMSFLMLVRTATSVSHSLDKFLTKHNLLRSRWLILVILMREPSQTMSPKELSKTIGITGATLSRLLESLDEEGLIKRVTCTDDRRGQKISMTAKGLKVLNKVMPGYYSTLGNMFADLSKTDHKNLMKILKAVKTPKG